jgi:hypothetical protein
MFAFRRGCALSSTADRVYAGFQTERFRCLEIDSKQEVGGLLDGKLGRLALQLQSDLRIKCLSPGRVTIVTQFSRQRH